MAPSMRQEVEARARAACRIADVQAEGGRLDLAGYMGFVACFLNAKGLELTSTDAELLEDALQHLLSLSQKVALPGDEAARLLQRLYAEAAASAGLSPARTAPTPAPRPAGEDTIHEGYLICLEDGKRVKLLKRYLRTHFGMTPDDYRRKWGLPDDYPMIAPGLRKAARKRGPLASDLKDPEGS